MQPSDFPLAWPEGHARTPAEDRQESKFKVAFEAAYDGLVAEAEKLHDEDADTGGRDVIVSTNVPLDRDGLPLVKATGVADPGVCVYLWRGGRPYAIALDTYREVRDNLRAIAATIAALRTIQRHGAAPLLEQSMSGFAREVEGVPERRLLATGTEG